MSRTTRPLAEKIAATAFGIVLLPILLPLTALALLLYVLHRMTVHLLVWLLWIPKGKDTLCVYSDSPIWHDYMTQEVLPLVENRAVVLNWSERKKWKYWSLPVQVFHSFGGRQAFNPLVVLFRPFRRARTFRFWFAFRDFKHGDSWPVERIVSALRSELKNGGASHPR